MGIAPPLNFRLPENFLLVKKFSFKIQYLRLISPILRTFRDKIKISSSLNLLCRKFEDVLKNCNFLCVLSYPQLLNIFIPQNSASTQLSVVGCMIIRHFKLSTECANNKKIKIGQYLVKM